MNKWKKDLPSLNNLTLGVPNLSFRTPYALRIILSDLKPRSNLRIRVRRSDVLKRNCASHNYWKCPWGDTVVAGQPFPFPTTVRFSFFKRRRNEVMGIGSQPQHYAHSKLLLWHWHWCSTNTITGRGQKLVSCHIEGIKMSGGLHQNNNHRHLSHSVRAWSTQLWSLGNEAIGPAWIAVPRFPFP